MDDLMEQFVLNQDRIIEEHGHAVVAVLGDEGEDPFVYTVGLSLRGLPEILVFRFEPTMATRMLNELASEMGAGEGFEPGKDYHTFGGKCPFRTVAVDPLLDDHTHSVRRLGRTYRVLQMVVPDPECRWPGDPAIEPLYDVPVLGPAWWRLN